LITNSLINFSISWRSLHLHAHDGEDENDDSQHEAQVAQRAHRTTDDTNEKVQRRPRLGQLEHPQLNHKDSENLGLRRTGSKEIAFHANPILKLRSVTCHIRSRSFT